ncbi:ComEA family DNA-binding protein [Streptomyces sp. ISL-11]|uniref:ComEA family DNA-binding protein n=1 Tax=Streptomyces sp. ISL-11 TaxID=2819174 RepID=UPI001BEB5FD2|nr:ComEA family DNA-binding protein [Streptomyces sp. ISL-11]MBT2387829.1 ComEA family DNA-binding protein [Streptomyces sp. ISL-11]
MTDHPARPARSDPLAHLALAAYSDISTRDLPGSGGSQRERAAALFPGAPAPVRGSPDPPAPASAPLPLPLPDEPNRSRGPAAWRLAVGERLPMWVQLRCGIERRTLAALVIVLVAACAFAAHHFWAGRPQAVRAPERRLPAVTVATTAPIAAAPANGPGTAGPGPAAPGRAEPSGGSVVVDVAGKVRRPGIQRLPAGSRVVDALNAAGGAREGADTTGLNRARVLTDGEHIVVGSPQADTPPAGIQGGAGGTGQPGGPVSLNTATVEQLDALPGVGPVLAQHILDYRTRHGGFRSVDELRHVNGIGARRFTDLRPLVQP